MWLAGKPTPSGTIGDDRERQQDNNVTSGQVEVDTSKTRRKSKWKIYERTKFRKRFQYLERRFLGSSVPVATTASDSECDSSRNLSIPKSDKNWVRIQVTYDSDDEKCFKEGGKGSEVSEVSVNYNSRDSESQWSESSVNVPAEFQKIGNRRNELIRHPHKKGVRDTLRAYWIGRDPEYHPQKSNCKTGNESEHHLKVDHRQSSSSQIMGVTCSTKLGKLRKHAVAPAGLQSVITCEQKTPHGLPDNNVVPTAFHTTAQPIQTYPDLFSGDNAAFPTTSSTIEWDNILHRRHGVPLHSSVTTSGKANRRLSSPKLGVPKPAMSVTSLTLPQETGVELRDQYRRSDRITGGRLLKSFNGSVQNLVNFFKSASESNLTNLPSDRRTNSRTSETFHSHKSGVDYCPSVLYSRRQIADSRASAKSNERGSNLKNIKKIFTGSFYNMKKSKDSDNKLQDLDGGFFEKFGSLLRQKSQMEDAHLSTPLAPLPEEEDDMTVDTAVILESVKETEHDSGTETLETSHESDSEPDDLRSHHDSFIEGAVGMNIDELYEEVLFEILNNIGCEASEEVSQSALLEYVQDAFKIANDKHDEIMQGAEKKEPPEIRLNVEIIKAENLFPKDSNGFSDPFVTLYLESCASHRYNTSVKAATLNPLWEEHFSLPIPENPNQEILALEVWDFDAAETVGEKMNKLFEVKGVRGLRKLMKEIAVAASTGKHDNELIGKTAIPLKTIPASGIKVWYSLEKGTKSKSRGSVLLRLSFSAEKNNRVAAQEHRHLLKILLMHELESSKVAPYWWRGKFSAQGEAVLTQHSAQSGLMPLDCSLAQWSVFAQVHQDHPLAFALFNLILDKIIPTLQTLPADDDEVKFFWEGARRLLPSCFSIIRKLRKKTMGDKNSVKMLTEVLDIISKIAMLEPPEGFDLLPKQVYGWVIREDDGPNWDLRGALKDATNKGAEEWFEHIHDGNDSTRGSEEDRLQNLIKIIQLIRSDLQKSIEYYDKHFQQKMHFSYAQTLYLCYEGKLAEIIQPVVDDVCRNIKRLKISEERFEKLPEYQEINMGTTLFELYLVLKRFTTLGTALCPADENLSIYKYHEWFTPGVTHWLDISVYKALTRIEKAIDLDKLVPVDDTVKYSSSAVDTLAIFYQIKIFWQQLGWPDVEGAYMFVGKIVDDICRCCVFYADRMSKRVEELNYDDQQGFEVTREWCLAINNIDYIRQSLSPFIKELGVDDIIAKLSEFRSEMEADRCAATVKNVIENAIDTERNKILLLIDVVAMKMSPAMRRFLTEGAEVLHEDSNSMDRLMMYLEDSLETLHTELNEQNFERILDAIWAELSSILYELVQNNLDKRRPPAFFANLRGTLHLMVSSFKLQQSSEATSSDRETLEHIERLLELHAYETADLIHQYYLERLEDQKHMNEMPYGQLTVRSRFDGNVLKVDIMNARNLVPMDSNGSCDSFVKIHFMPADKFLGISCPKTNTQHKTLFPLYDEKFSISLTEEQRKMGNALLLFSVKDKDLFGMSNQYIAECYLSFTDIDNSENDQIHLTLSRPEYKDTDCLRALEHRQGDKQARDFVKKLKQKSY